MMTVWKKAERHQPPSISPQRDAVTNSVTRRVQQIRGRSRGAEIPFAATTIIDALSRLVGCLLGEMILEDALLCFSFLPLQFEAFRFLSILLGAALPVQCPAVVQGTIPSPTCFSAQLQQRDPPTCISV
jgi:hypothetical protein